MFRLAQRVPGPKILFRTQKIVNSTVSRPVWSSYSTGYSHGLFSPRPTALSQSFTATGNFTFGQPIVSPSNRNTWSSFGRPFVRNYAGLELKSEGEGDFVNPYLQKISEMIDSDQYDRALKTVRSYLEEVPDDPQGHFLKGLALYMKGEHDEARQAFERAVQIDSKMSPARTFLGLLCKDAGELRDAVAIFDSVLAENEDDQVARLNRGVCMRELGLPARAIHDFDFVIDREPGFAIAYRERGILKAKTQQYESALDDLNKCIGLDKEDAEVFYYQGLVLQRLQKLEEALKAFETVLELEPDHATAGLRRGRVLSLLGRHETAKQVFDKLEKKGKVPDAAVFKAREQAVMGESVEALGTLDEVLKKQPKNSAAQVERGNIYTSEEHFDEGRQAYEKVLQNEPKNLAALIGLGTNAALAGAHKKAQAYFTAALVVEPNNVQALLGLAASHGILNEHQPAMAAFDRLIVLQPDNVEALLGKAMSAFALEDIKTAVPLFMRVEELDPENGQLTLIKHGLERLTAEMEASHITGDPMDDTPLNLNPIKEQMRARGYNNFPEDETDMTGPDDDNEYDDDQNPAPETVEEEESDPEEDPEDDDDLEDQDYEDGEGKFQEDAEVDDQDAMRQYMRRSRESSADLSPEEYDRPQFSFRPKKK